MSPSQRDKEIAQDAIPKELSKWMYPTEYHAAVESIAAALSQARAEEREACAKLCDADADRSRLAHDSELGLRAVCRACINTAEILSEAIRARGEA